ncbi:MAG: 16S rRNA (guanine(527)-N(7))-methyltransferase RsmG [Saprospiraceae bacterium]
MEVILKYFPDLSAKQIDQFKALGPLYESWNQKINVISRKDIDNLYVHHILHSLAIAKVVGFKPGAAVLDLGTGGGLPGIPLAIFFPETNFTLVDGTRKKITVVNEIKMALGLENVVGLPIRAEELKTKFDFVVCRAVTSLDKLIEWSFPLLKIKQQQHALPNGLITLKGGSIRGEIDALPKGNYVESFPISNYFKEDYFLEKMAVYAQV